MVLKVELQQDIWLDHRRYLVTADPLSHILLLVHGVHTEQKFQLDDAEREGAVEEGLRSDACLDGLETTVRVALWRLLPLCLLQINQVDSDAL